VARQGVPLSFPGARASRPRSRKSLGLRLRGTRSGPTPVGARVTVRSGGRTQVRWQSGGTGYLSAHDPRLWFGLGSSARVERLEVRWPTGAVQSLSDVPGDRLLEIREGDPPMSRAGPGR
jgi:hypothetical protein